MSDAFRRAIDRVLSESDDPSIWHATPMSMHSLCKPNGVGKGTDFIGVDFFSRLCGVLNAVTLQLQGKLGGRTVSHADLVLTSWQWTAPYLRGVWSTEGLSVTMTALLAETDDAVIEFRLSTEQAFVGAVQVLGDENLDTMGDWGKYKLDGSFKLHPDGVVVHKDIIVGQYSDVFPWVQPIQDRLPMHWTWFDHYDNWAVHVPGTGWTWSTVPCDEHPERKRATFTERTGHIHEDDTAELAGRKRWAASREVDLAADRQATVRVNVAFGYSGKDPMTTEASAELLQRAVGNTESMDTMIETRTTFWRNWLGRVPVPRDGMKDTWLWIYAKAWVTSIANLYPPFYAGVVDFTTPVFATNKVASGFQCPCVWESALGSLLMGYVDVELAAESLNSIVDCIEEDGIIVEDTGFGRGTTLPIILAEVALQLYRRGMNRIWLQRWYQRLRWSWRVQSRYPCYKRLGSPSCRNYFYAYLNGRAVLEIARIVDTREEEIDWIERRLSDLHTMVQAFWNDEHRYWHAQIDVRKGGPAQFEYVPGTNGEVLIGLADDAVTDDQAEAMLELLRDDLLRGEVMVANIPLSLDGVEMGYHGEVRHANFAIKPSNYLYLWRGLKQRDPELFRTIVDRTLEGISRAGDFSENYSLKGTMEHNQPMSFFGMFAVIYSVMMDDRYGEE